MNVLFFGSLIVYFVAMALQFVSMAFRKEKDLPSLMVP